MELLKKTVIVVMILAGFIACKKEKNDDAVPAISITGKWVGVFTNSGSPTQHFYSFNIKSGGVLEKLNDAGEKIAEGAWQLNGDTFTGSYESTIPIYTSFSVIGTLESPTKLSGAWGQGSNQTNGGFWNMTRQP